MPNQLLGIAGVEWEISGFIDSKSIVELGYFRFTIYVNLGVLKTVELAK